MTAWALSRRFRLAPAPAAGDEADREPSSHTERGERLELAWDGHRVMACREGDDVRFWSADFREWTQKLTPLALALRKLPAHKLVLDGFLCALDDRGRPSFAALREYVRAPTKGVRLAFVAWDAMLIDDDDLTGLPLATRIGRLEKLFEGKNEPLVLSQPLEGSSEHGRGAVLESLLAMGVRGVVARALDAPYPPPEDRPWISLATSDEPVAWERSLSAPPIVSNADKVLYPRDGITKADIVAYYDDVAPLMLRVLEDRPVVCQRWPDGIDDFTWYQHRMPPRAPDYLRAVWIEGNRRIVLENREALLWMVNQAALTIHGWASRVRSLQHPDWVILDLDPGEATRWEQVIEVALAIRKLLEMLELPSVVKTSGQKGLHVLIPIAPGHTVAQCHELGMRAAMLVARLFPSTVCLEATTETRKGRLYLDHLQSFVGKSLVLPYSLRAADKAPASTPIGWDEVTTSLDPRAFNLRTLRGRLDRKGDLAEPLTKGKTQLAPALAKLRLGS